MTNSGHAHAISIRNNPNRITVSFHGTVIAETSNSLILKEGPVPPAHYIPWEDVRMSYLQRSDHTTHCPFKGDASYFSVNVHDKTAENAVWSYETPIDSVNGIKDYVSFYPEKMDAIIEECKRV